MHYYKPNELSHSELLECLRKINISFAATLQSDDYLELGTSAYAYHFDENWDHIEIGEVLEDALLKPYCLRYFNGRLLFIVETDRFAGNYDGQKHKFGFETSFFSDEFEIFFQDVMTNAGLEHSNVHEFSIEIANRIVGKPALIDNFNGDMLYHRLTVAEETIKESVSDKREQFYSKYEGYGSF